MAIFQSCYDLWWRNRATQYPPPSPPSEKVVARSYLCAGGLKFIASRKCAVFFSSLEKLQLSKGPHGRLFVLTGALYFCLRLFLFPKTDATQSHQKSARHLPVDVTSNTARRESSKLWLLAENYSLDFEYIENTVLFRQPLQSRQDCIGPRCVVEIIILPTGSERGPGG